MKFSGRPSFENSRKKFKLNLVLLYSFSSSNLKVTIKSFSNATNLHYNRIKKKPDAVGASFSVRITLGAFSTVGLLLSAMLSSNLSLEPSSSPSSHFFF